MRSAAVSNRTSVSNANKSIQTTDLPTPYEHKSTQTADSWYLQAQNSLPAQYSPSLSTQYSVPTDDMPSLWTGGSVKLTSPEEYNGLISTNPLQAPAGSDLSQGSSHKPHGQSGDEDMILSEFRQYARGENAQDDGLVVEDAQIPDGPPYTNGEAQIVMASDGSKSCLALLLTSEMVTKIGQIATRSRRLDFITGLFRETKQEITSADNLMEYKRDALQDTNDQAEVARINEEIERTQERRKEAAERLNALEEETETLTANLVFSREQFQEMFETVLSRMDLLEVPEPEVAAELGPTAEPDDSVEQIAGPEERYAAVYRDDDGHADQMELDETELAKKDFEEKRNALIILDEAFENRQANLAEEKAEYRRRVREGTCHITQTEFDLLALGDFRKVTAELQRAQDSFEESFRRAKQLGVLDERDAHYQESVFSEWSGGYAMSMEDAMIGSAPTKRISYWQETVEQSQDKRGWGGTELEPWGAPDIEPETLEMEDCEVRSAAISDSWSCVDRSRNRKRIDHWREIAGRER